MPSSPAKIPAKDPSGDLAQLAEGTVNDAATNRIAHVLHPTSAYPDQLELWSVPLTGVTRGRRVAGTCAPGRYVMPPTWTPGGGAVVVTGAPNLKVGDRGQKVAFALEGARLFDGHKPGWETMTLKTSKIRGIESGCMVCSEKELGISEDHEGIIILPDDAPVGKPLADYLGDVIFDIKVNPNMARCASMIGIAREVAALTGKKLRMPSLKVVAHGAPIKGQVKKDKED